MTSSFGDAPQTLLVRDLHVWRGGRRRGVHAVRGINLDLRLGETVGVVGESGSGKSSLVMAIARLLEPGDVIEADRLELDGRDLLALSPRELRSLRSREIGLVYQQPSTSLNPVMGIGAQVDEVFEAHGLAQEDCVNTAVDLLRAVSIPDPDRRVRQYPHQLSGGMRQRVVLAMALALHPQLLIADEPTSALDVTTQAGILRQIRETAADRRRGTLLVTHDLGVVAGVCDRVIVLRDGEVVEEGPTADVFEAPRHHYVRQLRDASHLERADVRTEVARPPARAASCAPADTVVVSDRLSRRFTLQRPLVAAMTGRRPVIHALDEVSISIGRGQRVGIVGESGSGKSTLARAIAGLDPTPRGHLRVLGTDPAELRGARLRAHRQRVQLIYQDPIQSLTPTMSVRQLLAEAIAKGPGEGSWHDPTALLDAVWLDASILTRRPTELSGGQAQRIAIARALAVQPDILVADEAVSSVDATTKLELLRLISTICSERGLTLVLVSHDLSAVGALCDDLYVMYMGRVVESGPTTAVVGNPSHPYTAALLAARTAPVVGRLPAELMIGEPQSATSIPSGCPFKERCPIGPRIRPNRTDCEEVRPELSGEATHSACHHSEDVPELIGARSQL